MYDIIPQRKEFLAGLQGLGGGPTGYQFRKTIIPDKNWVDDFFLVNTRTKNAADTTLMQYSADRIDAGMHFAQTGAGKSLLVNWPGRWNNQAFIKDSALTGATAGKTFTVSFWWFPMNTQTGARIMGFGRTDVAGARFEITIGHYLAIAAWNSSNSKFFDVYTSSYQPVKLGEWQHIIISFDLSSTSKRYAYIDDTSFTNWTWQTYGNQNILFDSEGVGVLCERQQNGSLGGSPPNGYVRDFYFDQNYLDISQESNRRIFRTASGEPVSQASLEARNPLVYMRWDDQDTIETNLGTGGNFHKNVYNDSTYHVVNFGPDKADASKVKGGMIWTKRRNLGDTNHLINDTDRGEYALYPNDTSQEYAESVNGFAKFDYSGITLAPNSAARNKGPANADAGGKYVDWIFQRQPGFFDMITYSGNGVSGREIDHNLDCVPGLMIVKCRGGGTAWAVYDSNDHNGYGGPTRWLQLDSGDTSTASSSIWNNIAPTATKFTVGNHAAVNTSGQEYICYLFGQSHSPVEWRGHDSYQGLTMSTSDTPFSNTYSVHGKLSDTSSTGMSNIRFWPMGSDDYTCPGEFTWEMFYQQNGSNYCYLFTIGDSGSHDGGTGIEAYFSGSTLKIYRNGSAIDDGGFTQGGTSWHHFAMTRDSGNTLKVYIDGTVQYTISNVTGDVGPGERYNSQLPISIGMERYNSSEDGRMDTRYSNCRLTKGQVLYTSNFTKPSSSLTTTSQGATEANVKLLALQGPTPGSYTVAAERSKTATEYSFGKDADQGIINVGRYKGNGTSIGPVISVGWQPQYLLIKSTEPGNNQNWIVIDKQRDVALKNESGMLHPNTTNNEQGSTSAMFTATGFRITNSGQIMNGNGKWYMFMAIRFPDGKVGRPPEIGNEAFNMDVGSGSNKLIGFKSSVSPHYSDWAVDWAFQRQPATTAEWLMSGRLLSEQYWALDGDSGSSDDMNFNFDYNTGWGANSSGGWNSSTQSWMWKRGQGFDLQTFRGGSNLTHHHNLGVVPEMIWVKMASAGGAWYTYHMGLNGGVDPANWYVRLKDEDPVDNHLAWQDTMPTKDVFTTGTMNDAGADSAEFYFATLFASVDKISKCGWYTGDGTLDGSHEINLGFTPRVLIIKCVTSGVSFSHWRIWDALNGLDGTGSESYLKLNTNGAKVSSYDYINTTATGFKFNTAFGPVNGNGNIMIYYAHA